MKIEEAYPEATVTVGIGSGNVDDKINITYSDGEHGQDGPEVDAIQHISNEIFLDDWYVPADEN